MYVNGNISYPVFYNFLDKGEIYPDGWTQEEEKKLLEEEKPKAEEVTLSQIEREPTVDADASTEEE